MLRRARRLLLVFGLVMASLVLSTSVGLAQAVGVTPGSAPPGTEITVFGDGFAPGEEITVFFGGTEVVTFADDGGSFTVSLTIDELMPPGMHPLDISAFPSGYFETFDYEVEEPPPPTTTTSQPPTTTTTAAATTTAAPTTTASPATTAAPATTAPATTVPDTTVPPTTIVDDTRVSTSDGGGVPWWLFLLAIVLALALGAGVMMAINNASAMKAGEFTDDKGNKWRICSLRTCKIERTNRLDNTRVIRTVPKKDKCGSGCKCVLFSWPKKGEGTPKFEDEDGDWVVFNATRRYKGRCVESI